MAAVIHFQRVYTFQTINTPNFNTVIKTVSKQKKSTKAIHFLYFFPSDLVFLSKLINLISGLHTRQRLLSLITREKTPLQPI